MTRVEKPVGVVDLRSDTVTRPTDAMRRAIAEAEVGDDVFGDDPTVHALEETTAQILGKEAAVFVPSGTMANEIAVAAHTRPGDEIILEAGSHIFMYEGGGPAVLSGVQAWPIAGTRGMLTPENVRSALRPSDPHFPRTRLLCLENTHNRSGGRVLPPEEFRQVVTTAHELGLRVHLDGARLWNAAAASGKPESEIAADVDSVSACFSKGLGAPVGSVVAGRADWIERARHVRKRFGGGMRQAGLLAAGALHALEHHRARLVDDHRRARRLAEALSRLPGLHCSLEDVETNIVVVRVEPPGTAEQWLTGLEERGVWAVPFGPETLRFVTHLDVDDDALDRALAAATSVAGTLDGR